MKITPVSIPQKQFEKNLSAGFRTINASLFPKRNTTLRFSQKPLTLDSLKLLSKTERRQLNAFFNFVMKQHAWGYTIFGDKPASIIWWFNKENNPYFQMQDRLQREGMDAWKKLSLLPKNYAVVTGEDIQPNRQFAMIINKLALSKVLQQHPAPYQQVFGEKVVPSAALETLAQGGEEAETLVRRILQHDGLLGLVLGYGERNADLFHRRVTMYRSKIPLVEQTPSQGFQTAVEEMQFLNQQLPVSDLEPEPKTWVKSLLDRWVDWGTRLKGRRIKYHIKNFFYQPLWSYVRPENFDGRQVKLPIFFHNPNDPETKLLKEHYLQKRKVIQKVCDRQDVLEQVIEQLTG